MKKSSIQMKITALLLGFGMAAGTVACGKGGGAESDDSLAGTPETEATLTVSTFDSPVYLVHDGVLGYLQADEDQLVNGYLVSGTRTDKGKPVTLSYGVEKSEKPIDFAYAEISLTEDFSSVVCIELFEEDSTSVDVYNLQTDMQYYFRIVAQEQDDEELSASGSFVTAASPRFISLDGACNVRDIGGWKTEDGKTVKQGLLYRGSEIDGGKNTGHVDFCLTEKGIEQLRALGIKTDLDLRSESVKVSEYSILGADVNRTFYDAAQYQTIVYDVNAERTRAIFSALAKPEAYPVYMHCTHGVDRAGSTAFLLNALLGVSKADLIRDYELSAFYYNFAHVNRNVNNGGTILKLASVLEDYYEGETFAEKVASFLLSIGVTQAEIDSIRSILLSD